MWGWGVGSCEGWGSASVRCLSHTPHTLWWVACRMVYHRGPNINISLPGFAIHGCSPLHCCPSPPPHTPHSPLCHSGWSTIRTPTSTSACPSSPFTVTTTTPWGRTTCQRWIFCRPASWSTTLASRCGGKCGGEVWAWARVGAGAEGLWGGKGVGAEECGREGREAK